MTSNESGTSVAGGGSGRNTFAILGLVCGVVGLVFFWFAIRPFFNGFMPGFVFLGLPILAVVFSCIGLSRVRRVDSGKGPAVAGLVLAALYFVLTFLAFGRG